MIGVEEQLHFLQFLQEWRGPWIDSFFRFLNLLDTGGFIISLDAFIWIGLSWRWGARLGYLFILNGAVNALAKQAFSLPRPGLFDPSLPLVALKGFGFPSGAAQTAALLACLLIYYWKSPRAWPLGIFYAALLGFSRLFLGVHFPLDLAGGYCLGLFLAGLFILARPSIESFAAAKPGSALLGSVFASFVLGMILPPAMRYLMIMALTISAGIYFSTKYSLYFAPPRTWSGKIFLGLFAVFSAVLLGAALVKWWSAAFWLQVWAGAIWISLAVSPLCKRLFPRIAL